MKNTRKKHSKDAWNSHELGTSEAFVRKVSSRREKALDKNLGLQIISIRLQKDLINHLKNLADKDGLGYQPYIRQVLTQHVRNEKRKHEKHLKIINKE